MPSESPFLPHVFGRAHEIVEAYTVSKALTRYPTRPIDLDNKRKAVSRKLNDAPSVVFTLPNPSTLFRINADGEATLEMAPNGLSKLSYREPSELSDADKAIADEVNRLDDGLRLKCIAMLKDFPKFVENPPEDEILFDFVARHENLDAVRAKSLAERIEKGVVLKERVFWPTVVDLVRIFEAMGIESIPMSMLKQCQTVDDDYTGFIRIPQKPHPSKKSIKEDAERKEKLSQGASLFRRIATSRHEVKPNSGQYTVYANVKPNRLNVMATTLGGNVGDVVYCFPTSNEKKAPMCTLYTMEGVVVGIRTTGDRKSQVATAYFTSPNDVIRDVQRHKHDSYEYGSFKNNHPTDSVPTKMLRNCIRNVVMGWVDLDSAGKPPTHVVSGAPTRRYVEMDD